MCDCTPSFSCHLRSKYIQRAHKIYLDTSRRTCTLYFILLISFTRISLNYSLKKYAITVQNLILINVAEKHPVNDESLKRNDNLHCWLWSNRKFSSIGKTSCLTSSIKCIFGSQCYGFWTTNDIFESCLNLK